MLTDKEYDEYMDNIDRLIRKDDNQGLTNNELNLLESLSIEVEEYEQKYYPMLGEI